MSIVKKTVKLTARLDTISTIIIPLKDYSSNKYTEYIHVLGILYTFSKIPMYGPDIWIVIIRDGKKCW